MASTTSAPVSESQLHLIAKDACETTLSSATQYTHSQTESWNSAIINKILTSLISSASSTSSSEPTPSSKPQYKYAVNSTIIQHLEQTASAATTASTGTSTEAQTASPPHTPDPGATTNGVSSESNSVIPSKGKRGMHSATGAYWNNDTDGMWNYKWEGGESKGMDVVISVIWVAI